MWVFRHCERMPNAFLNVSIGIVCPTVTRSKISFFTESACLYKIYNKMIFVCFMKDEKCIISILWSYLPLILTSYLKLNPCKYHTSNILH